MKSIMSCSSLSSIMRSLGLLLRVSTINWCRSMPVESVYSTLDSESDTGTGRMCYKTTNTIRNYTAILNTPGEPHVNSGTESNFITFYLLPSFLSFMRYFRKHTHTFGQWRFLWICAALLLLFLFTGSSPVVMAARWDVCVWRCLKKKERKNKLSVVVMVMRRRWMIMCVRVLPRFLQMVGSPHRQLQHALTLV